MRRRAASRFVQEAVDRRRAGRTSCVFCGEPLILVKVAGNRRVPACPRCHGGVPYTPRGRQAIEALRVSQPGEVVDDTPRGVRVRRIGSADVTMGP